MGWSQSKLVDDDLLPVLKSMHSRNGGGSYRWVGLPWGGGDHLPPLHVRRGVTALRHHFQYGVSRSAVGSGSSHTGYMTLAVI